MTITEKLQAMTLEEKAAMLVGKTFWQTQDIPRVDIDSITMCDGPHGLRKQLSDSIHSGSVEATCFPTASALACSFDPELMASVGKAIALECKAEDVQLLLGPGINMKTLAIGR